MLAKYIPMRPLSAKTAALFWEGVDKTGGEDACWPWIKSRDGNGYGKMKIGGIHYRSHRLSYWLTHNVDPGDRLVCHKCDNPPCCNPAHHFLGSMSDNLKDCVAKGRMPIREQAGEANGAAKLSAEQVEAVRDMIRAGKNNVQIGRVFGVTHQAISRIRRGKTGVARRWGRSTRAFDGDRPSSEAV